ncbi:MAG: peptidoglycan bridge formation glycyltransferase FemA/FemB family protein [Candidatus Margulisbacteria bacterium]|nr:peptidoglycan bridge formation glycyltransferase FemA/FemB family protein [Candidatus Margulisiibacteriota bacterium]
MKSRLITFAEKDRWNDFAANHQESPVLQSFEWGELKANFGWQPLRIAIEDQGKIVAGISILKREIPYVRHSIFYAPRGPLVDFSNRELLESLLSSVEKEAEKHHAISLKIDPDINEERKDILDLLHRLGFEKAPKQVQPRATILLDLSRGLDDLLMSFEEKTRYNIRLAEKKGVVVREDPSQKGVELFHEMYKETAKRDNFLIHPLSYYQKIREKMFEKGLGSNFIAYYNSKPIAAVIIFCFGSKIWYMYGASTSEHRNLMPNHLLHWRIMAWAKERNYKTYDLWGIPANPKEGHPLWGVYRFKKGFGGKPVKYIGAYDFPYSPLFYHLLEHGIIWWQNLRSLITKGKIEDSLSE